MIKKLFPLFLLIVLASCSSDPVKVVVDKKDLSKGKITIDGKDQRSFKDSVIVLLLKPGKHTVAIDNEAAKDFTVGDNGGLLNLDNQEYVAYEIEYAEQNSNSSFTMNSMRLKAMMLIDSFVIIPKGAFAGHTDSSLRKLLPALKQAKNGNYFYSMGNEGNVYDNSLSVQGIKKFGKDKLYIESFWDFTLGEKIPETLTITTRKSSISIGTSSTTRTSIMHAPLFLLMARLTPEEYTIKTIAEIEAGTEDKEKEATRQQSQMKF
ncbi:MAG: hypothetical protein ABUL44_01420 [Flavobacterium sp.]